MQYSKSYTHWKLTGTEKFKYTVVCTRHYYTGNASKWSVPHAAKRAITKTAQNTPSMITSPRKLQSVPPAVKKAITETAKNTQCMITVKKSQPKKLQSVPSATKRVIKATAQIVHCMIIINASQKIPNGKVLLPGQNWNQYLKLTLIESIFSWRLKNYKFFENHLASTNLENSRITW